MFHCDRCHHEWEGSWKDQQCDWCGGGSILLAEKTALEKMLDRRADCQDDDVDWPDPDNGF